MNAEVFKNEIPRTASLKTATSKTETIKGEVNFNRSWSFLNAFVPVVLSMSLLFSQSTFALTSQSLIGAAHAEIGKSKNTSCSTYVMRVLNRVGISVGSFQANGFHFVMQSKLPSWGKSAFRGNAARPALRNYLNSYPDGTAFFAQWKRSGRSGHVAIVQKRGFNRFQIFQAQQGLARPHTKPVTIEGLLYARNQYGDRSNLTLWAP